MKYQNIHFGRFKKRPNRFIAYVEIDGAVEKVHVKNTGRCRELLTENAEVGLVLCDDPKRKTRYDLVSVKKRDRIINMDSQAPNKLIKECLEEGFLFENMTLLKPETSYKNSRFDFYAEADGKRIFIEVKGVTLERGNEAYFPDAPTIRGVRHIEELIEAKNEGYESYIIFVVQMKGITCVYPNKEQQPEFAEVLERAQKAGVHVLAIGCDVEWDRVKAAEYIPVKMERPVLKGIEQPIVDWYLCNRRDLPWRQHVSAYRTWVSEIMLQQTRVEAVKPYFERFLGLFPDIQALADADQETLLKAWEGLGYYNRVRNMQEAARTIVDDYGGEFPNDYEQIRALKGIGDYTAGAISSIAFGIAKPAADGNVYRVLSRLLEYEADIMKQSTRKDMNRMLEEIIPSDNPGDFNQGLIEIGAIVCVPNGEPKCEICPLGERCRARINGTIEQYPVKKKAKERTIEKRTVIVFSDEDGVALHKRPDKGLLAGMYELPALAGFIRQKELIEYSKSIGMTPIHIKKLEDAKHIFSHIEWHMKGYFVRVDELEKNCTAPFIFAKHNEIEEKYPIPSAFRAYRKYLD